MSSAQLMLQMHPSKMKGKLKMDTNAYTEGRFLRGQDVANKPRIDIIERVGEELLKDSSGTTTKKLVAYLKSGKAAVLNKGNIRTLQAAFGTDSDRWLGQKVRFVAERMMVSGRSVDALRVQTISGGAPVHVVEKRSLEAEMTYVPYSNADRTEPRTSACRFDKTSARIAEHRTMERNSGQTLRSLRSPQAAQCRDD
jgi:hypothetical protein